MSSSRVLSFLVSSHFVMLLVSASHVSEFNISEEVSIRTFVGSVRSNPDVVDLPESVRFRFRFATGPYLLFSIDEGSGEIRTARRIDREQLCSSSPCLIVLDVTVLPIRYYQIIKVAITVSDINDNSPTFPQSRLSLEVNENSPRGTAVSLPTAEDNDDGEFRVQRYEMSPVSDTFRLNVKDELDGSKDVSVTLQGRLDREKQKTYSIVLTAFDGGQPPRSATVNIDIIVSDANDNNPQFDSPVYEVEVSEDQSPGTTIVRVRATDSDDGLNGQVVYRFADHTVTSFGRSFAIDNVTGEIYLLSRLDYEQQSVYHLTVIGSDLGIGSLPTFTRVTISVIDENDNAPDVTVNPLTQSGRVEIIENSDIGTFVAYVAVRDADSGKNGLSECSIGRNVSGLLSLEPVSGSEYKLMTSSVFDREQCAQYTMTLRCVDKGTPAQSSVTKVDIFIVDENDNPPVLPTALYIISHPEGNAIGSVITRINASDADSGVNAQLSYYLTPVDGTQDNTLIIDQSSGTILTNIVFDYETRREYKYQLTVSDAGENPRSAVAGLVLQIVDMNDERPRFEKTSYYFTTVENRPAGAVVGTVHATDSDDTPAFSRIIYSLSQGNNVFEVHPTSGVISTTRPLDREQLAVYELSVRATNDASSDMFASVAVTIYVDDENDNEPVIRFPPANSVFHVSSLNPVGTLVTRVDASDADLGPNAVLSYSIANGNPESLFNIDSRTGALTVAANLSPADGKSYRLIVTVRDHGSPERLAVVDIIVAVNGTLSTGLTAEHATHPFSALLDAGNLTIVAAVVSGSVLVLIVFLVLVMILVCRWRRRKQRRRREWQRQQEAMKSLPIPGQELMSFSVSPVPSAVDRNSLRMWSSADKAFGTASATEQDDTENEDVPLSVYLRARRETDKAQTASLVSSLAPTSGPGGTPSQRTTPDIIRPAAGGGNGSIPVDTTTGPLLNCPSVRTQRARRHKPAGGHRRRARSPGYHRPGSASLTTGHRRQKTTAKSDLETSDRNDSESEYSETTCRDSGMDPSEDSDHVTYPHRAS